MRPITQTPGTATVNQLRENTFANETAIKDEVEQATDDIADHVADGNTDHDSRYSKITDLNTHKSSADHDGRYYTEAEIEAMIVKLTGSQTIAGQKILTSDAIIQKALPAVQLNNAAGNGVGRLISLSDTLLALQGWDSGSSAFKTLLSVDVTNKAIYDADGNAMASKQYVQDRVRAGFFRMNFSRNISSLVDGTTYYVQDDGGAALLVPVPNGATLKNVTHNFRLASAIGDEQVRNAVPIAFTDGGYQWLYIRLVFSNLTNSLALSIGAGRWSGGAESIAWTAVDAISHGDIATGNPVTAYIGLEFSI